MQFPLSLSFKIFGLAPQIYVTDAGGNSVLYVKQKLFKLKEAVQVYRDSSRQDLLYEIKADRIMDFRATYNFTDATGRTLGGVKRQGMRSIFSATYDIKDASGDTALVIREEAAWKRVLENMLGNIPVIGFLVIMFINPTYLVRDDAGNVLVKLVKQPAFFEGKFTIEKVGELGQDQQERVLLALLMMALLERSRG